MKNRDVLRAKKAIDQVERDMERRKKGRQEYRPKEPDEILPQPIKAPLPERQVIYVQPAKGGFSRGQNCLLLVLGSILGSICICGGLLALPAIIGDPPAPLFQPPNQAVQPVSLPTSRPLNVTRGGLIFTRVQMFPFASITTGPGNWWRLDVTVHNPTRQPITVKGYDVVLRDGASREFWYDQGNTMFNGDLIEQLNPGTTTTLSIIFNLPDQITGDLRAYYDGAGTTVDIQR